MTLNLETGWYAHGARAAAKKVPDSNTGAIEAESVTTEDGSVVSSTGSSPQPAHEFANVEGALPTVQISEQEESEKETYCGFCETSVVQTPLSRCSKSDGDATSQVQRFALDMKVGDTICIQAADWSHEPGRDMWSATFCDQAGGHYRHWSFREDFVTDFRTDRRTVVMNTCGYGICQYDTKQERMEELQDWPFRRGKPLHVDFHYSSGTLAVFIDGRAYPALDVPHDKDAALGGVNVEVPKRRIAFLELVSLLGPRVVRARGYEVPRAPLGAERQAWSKNWPLPRPRRAGLQAQFEELAFEAEDRGGSGEECRAGDVELGCMPIWEVVQPGGLQVYESSDMAPAAEAPDRPVMLGQGALIRQLPPLTSELDIDETPVDGKMLRFERYLGDGPASGWVRFEPSALESFGRESDPKPFVAIIVPYRNPRDEITGQLTQDRESQLKELLTTFQTHLRGSSANFVVVVAEQAPADRNPFNRGQVLNAGFVEAQEFSKKLGRKLDSVIFHDVDLIPSPHLLPWYSVPPRPWKPIHLAAPGLIHSEKYKKNDSRSWTDKPFFGGVVAIRPEDFEACNGFPNDYWGWGMEDDQLCLRMTETCPDKLIVERPPQHCGFYTDLDADDVWARLQGTAKDKGRDAAEAEGFNPRALEETSRIDADYRRNNGLKGLKVEKTFSPSIGILGESAAAVDWNLKVSLSREDLRARMCAFLAKSPDALPVWGIRAMFSLKRAIHKSLRKVPVWAVRDSIKVKALDISREAYTVKLEAQSMILEVSRTKRRLEYYLLEGGGPSHGYIENFEAVIAEGVLVAE